jgi:hypothetical protein
MIRFITIFLLVSLPLQLQSNSLANPEVHFKKATPLSADVMNTFVEHV